MKNRVAFIINAREGKPVSLSANINSKPYNMAASHPSFPMVVKELKKDNPDAAKIVKLMSKIEALKAFSQDKLVREGDKFYFQGQELRSSIVQRIQNFMKLDLPWKPMFRLLENIMQNPDPVCRGECIFAFLENENLTITPDGCFLGYKGAESDFWSKHTGRHTMLSGKQNERGQLYYGKGETLRIPREEVVADPDQSCARGIHVGSFTYAASWAGDTGALVLAKVNPKNVVSVTRHSREVMRVCELEVVESLPTRTALKQVFEPQYVAPDDEDAPTYHNVRNAKGRFTKARYARK